MAATTKGTLPKDGVSKKGRPTYRGDLDGWLVIVYGPNGEQAEQIEVEVKVAK
jgi:hypothetical protein